MAVELTDAMLEILWLLEDGVMMCSIFCVPLTKKKVPIVCGAFLLVGLLFANMGMERYPFLTLTVKLLLTPAILIVWTEGKIFRRLAIYWCSVMYLNLPYLCVDLVFCGFSGNSMISLESYTVYRILRSILSIIFMWVVSKVLRRMVLDYCGLINSMQIKYFVFGSICAFSASIVQHCIEEIELRKVYDKPGLTISVFVCMVIISVSFYLLGIGFVILDIFRKKYKEESKLKDEYLRITKDYVGMVRENAKETRKVRHDLQAHMHILQHYLEQKEYLKALEYLAKMQENMTRAIRKMVSVNHEIVDAVLQEAIVRGEGLQIQWEVDGVFPDNLSITDFDLCTIFSNLLSNSIEACRKLERENRYICLEIRRTEEHLLIEVENPVLTPVALENLGRVTEKDDGENHGFGIANVKATVEKNKGNIYFENKKGIFAVKILFTLEN